MRHPLAEVLDRAADGTFPPADGAVEVLPPDDRHVAVVVELTGHSYVLTDRHPDEVLARTVDGRSIDGFGGCSHPSVVAWLAGEQGEIGDQDVVLVARGTGDTEGARLPARDDLDDHPRVVRARRHRGEVAVHADDAGLVTIGTGLVSRRELSVEVTAPGLGHGRRLVRAGLGLVPAGEPVWAQVSPGNAASLRAFLAAGFVPIGSEILVVDRDGTSP